MIRPTGHPLWTRCQNRRMKRRTWRKWRRTQKWRSTSKVTDTRFISIERRISRTRWISENRRILWDTKTPQKQLQMRAIEEDCKRELARGRIWGAVQFRRTQSTDFLPNLCWDRPRTCLTKGVSKWTISCLIKSENSFYLKGIVEKFKLYTPIRQFQSKTPNESTDLDEECNKLKARIQSMCGLCLVGEFQRRVSISDRRWLAIIEHFWWLEMEEEMNSSRVQLSQRWSQMKLDLKARQFPQANY